MRIPSWKQGKLYMNHVYLYLVKKIRHSLRGFAGRQRGKVFRFRKSKGRKQAIQRKFAFVPSSWNSKDSSTVSYTTTALQQPLKPQASHPKSSQAQSSVSSPWGSSSKGNQPSSTWTDGPVWVVSNYSTGSQSSPQQDPSVLSWGKNVNNYPAAWNEKFRPNIDVEDNDETPRRPPSRCPSIWNYKFHFTSPHRCWCILIVEQIKFEYPEKITLLLLTSSSMFITTK